MGKLRAEAVRLGITWALGPMLQRLGDGGFGARAQAFYWALKGYKTALGALALLIGGALALFLPSEYAALAPTFAAAGAAFAGLGLIDKRLHWSAGDLPPWFSEGLHALIGFGSALAMLAGVCTHFLKPWPVWSDRVELGCAAIVLAVNYLSAKFTEAPAAPPAQ